MNCFVCGLLIFKVPDLLSPSRAFRACELLGQRASRTADHTSLLAFSLSSLPAVTLAAAGLYSQDQAVHMARASNLFILRPAAQAFLLMLY